MRVLANFLVAALLAIASSPSLAADELLGRSSVFFQADEVTYDQRNRLVSARGHVEIAVGDRVLHADEVSFDTKDEVIVARGNVAVLSPTGDVAFADTMELSADLRDGFLVGFRALLADRSRIAAAAATRSGGNLTEMIRGVFSSCELCPDDPARPPLWQLKAVRVVHDDEKQRITYEDATLEFFGVPVAYLPYFSHPDPRVKRLSGFLAPEYGSSTTLGTTLQVPYFFNISPNRDFTFEPIFTSREGVVAAGEYRERTETGRFDIKASMTNAEGRDSNNVKTGKEDFRGHIFSKGSFDPNETWRWGFDLNRTTDDTYLRRYGFSNSDSLTSGLFVEGYRQRNSISARSFVFQGLRQNDDPSRAAAIPLLADYRLITEPGRLGDIYSLDANVGVLTRDRGPGSSRISLNSGWQLPFISAEGSVYALSTNLRGDLYLVDDVVQGSGTASDGTSGRLVPQAALEWRYPLVRSDGAIRQTIEPIVLGIVAPYGGNPAAIPNEDSQTFEYDTTNLLSLNRFPGLDRVETGPRLTYGVRLGVYDAIGGQGTFLIGQSLRAKADDVFADKTGLEDKRSDYVSHLYFVPSSYIDLTNRLRLDRDTLSIRRNEITLSAGPPTIRFDTSYLALARELTTDELLGRQELAIGARVKITPLWTLSARTRQDLSEDRETLTWGTGLGYKDECFEFEINFLRSFFHDRDIEPSTSLKVRIHLKNLG